MESYSTIGSADHVALRYGFKTGTLASLCAVAQLTRTATATVTDDQCGIQLIVVWYPDCRIFACEVFDGRWGGHCQERFNVPPARTADDVKADRLTQLQVMTNNLRVKLALQKK